MSVSDIPRVLKLIGVRGVTQRDGKREGKERKEKE